MISWSYVACFDRSSIMCHATQSHVLNDIHKINYFWYIQHFWEIIRSSFLGLVKRCIQYDLLDDLLYVISYTTFFLQVLPILMPPFWRIVMSFVLWIFWGQFRGQRKMANIRNIVCVHLLMLILLINVSIMLFHSFIDKLLGREINNFNQCTF